jgi:hypothetical protein
VTKNEHFLYKSYIDTHLKKTDRIVKLPPHTNDLFGILDKCPGTFQSRHALQICYFFNNSIQGATITTINVSKGQNPRETGILTLAIVPSLFADLSEASFRWEATG